MNTVHPDGHRSFPPRERPVANVASRAILPGGPRNGAQAQPRLWKILWVLSVFMIFETSIRSIGQPIAPMAIGVLPGIWLSDVGLLLPVLFVLVRGKLPSALLRNRGLMVCVIAAAYGVSIGVIRGNWFSAIMADVRVFFALVSGLCLVEVVPRKLSTLAGSMVIVSVVAVFLATWTVLTSPRFAFSTSLGVTDPSAFVTIGLSVCLVTPGIILSNVVGNRILVGLGWLGLGTAVVTSIAVMQSRALSLVFILAVLTALVGVFVLARLQPRTTKNGVSRRRWSGVTSSLLFLVIIVPVLMWQREGVQLFLERLQRPVRFGIESDINTAFRIGEARQALGAMSWGDHLVGMGFGVGMSDFDLSVRSIYALHIGVLNLWWRLGVLPFLAVAMLFLRSVVYYRQSIRYLLHRPRSEAPRIGRAMTTIICTPGIMALGLAALLSGGWAITSMLSLGILWGIRRALVSSGWRLLRGGEA